MVSIRVVTAEFFNDVVAVDEMFELIESFGEVDFAGYDGVEPAFDYVPYALNTKYVRLGLNWFGWFETLGVGELRAYLERSRALCEPIRCLNFRDNWLQSI